MDTRLDTKALTNEARRAVKPPTDYRLAKTLGVEPSTIGKWKRGETKPNGPNLMKLLQLAGKLALALAVMLPAYMTPESAHAGELRARLNPSTSYTK